MADCIEGPRELLTRVGFVRRVFSEQLEVSVRAASGCISCAIRENCRDADAVRTFRVPCKESSRFNVGDAVQVSTLARSGLAATLLLFLVPVALLVGAVFVALAAGASEAAAAGLGLAAAALWALVLRLLNPRLQSAMPVRVERVASGRGGADGGGAATRAGSSNDSRADSDGGL